jgi:small subunit ribosomal protein S21
MDQIAEARSSATQVLNLVYLGTARSVTALQLERSSALKVFVRDNNVEHALRVLKKKLQREGLFREIKRRRAYEKPSESARGSAGGKRPRRNSLSAKACFRLRAPNVPLSDGDN